MLFNEKMLAGLGRGIVSTGKLDPEAVTRSMEEFRRFRALSDQAGAEQLYVIATAAAREAENGPDFIHRAEADPRHRDPRAVAAARRPITPRSASFPASIRPTASPATSAAAASNWSTSTAMAIGDGITLPLGGLRLQDMAKNSLAAAAKIARERTGARQIAEGRARAGPSTPSAAPGETLPGCT